MLGFFAFLLLFISIGRAIVVHDHKVTNDEVDMAFMILGAIFIFTIIALIIRAAGQWVNERNRNHFRKTACGFSALAVFATVFLYLQVLIVGGQLLFLLPLCIMVGLIAFNASLAVVDQRYGMDWFNGMSCLNAGIQGIALILMAVVKVY